jgi:hypothetical protein
MRTIPGVVMRRSAQRVLLISLLLLGAVSAPAFAQNREKAWEVNPYFGYLWIDEVQGQKILKNTWDAGFRFGYHWTKHHEMEFGFFGASTENGEDLDLNADLLGGQVNYDYNFFLARRGKVVGFGTAGVGLINISSFGFVGDPDLVGDKVEFSYNYGAGIRFFGGPRAGFRMDIRRVTFSDEDVDVHYLEAAVGMTIVLGGA